MKNKEKEREKKELKDFSKISNAEEYEQMMDDYLEDTFRNDKKKPKKRDGWS